MQIERRYEDAELNYYYPIPDERKEFLTTAAGELFTRIDEFHNALRRSYDFMPPQMREDKEQLHHFIGGLLQDFSVDNRLVQPTDSSLPYYWRDSSTEPLLPFKPKILPSVSIFPNTKDSPLYSYWHMKMSRDHAQWVNYYDHFFGTNSDNLPLAMSILVPANEHALYVPNLGWYQDYCYCGLYSWEGMNGLPGRDKSHVAHEGWHGWMQREYADLYWKFISKHPSIDETLAIMASMSQSRAFVEPDTCMFDQGVEASYIAEMNEGDYGRLRFTELDGEAGEFDTRLFAERFNLGIFLMEYLMGEDPDPSLYSSLQERLRMRTLDGFKAINSILHKFEYKNIYYDQSLVNLKPCLDRLVQKTEESGIGYDNLTNQDFWASVVLGEDYLKSDHTTVTAVGDAFEQYYVSKGTEAVGAFYLKSQLMIHFPENVTEFVRERVGPQMFERMGLMGIVSGHRSSHEVNFLLSEHFESLF